MSMLLLLGIPPKLIFFKNVYFLNSKTCYGSLAQNSFGAIRRSCNTRFRTRFRRVPEGSGDEVPKGSGADAWGVSGKGSGADG